VKLLNKLHLFYDLDDFITIISNNPPLTLKRGAGMTSNTSLVTALQELPIRKKKKKQTPPTKSFKKTSFL